MAALHSGMQDAFFASVATLGNPAFQGKPLVRHRWLPVPLVPCSVYQAAAAVKIQDIRSCIACTACRLCATPPAPKAPRKCQPATTRPGALASLPA